MYTNQTAKELANAIKAIISTDIDSTNEKQLIVSSLEDAETLSQLMIDAENGRCSITGPYLQPVNGNPKKVWYVEI